MQGREYPKGENRMALTEACYLNKYLIAGWNLKRKHGANSAFAFHTDSSVLFGISIGSFYYYLGLLYQKAPPTPPPGLAQALDPPLCTIFGRMRLP